MKKLFLIGLFTLCSLSVSAAITFDTSGNSGCNNCTTHSITITVASGSNRGMFALFSGRACGTDTVSGVTWNTTETFSLTKQQIEGSGAVVTEIWELVAPTTGSHTATITLTGSCSRSIAYVGSYAGVDQTNPTEGTPCGDNGTATSASCSVTSLTNNSWPIDVVGHRFNELHTPGGTQVEREDQTQSNNFGAAYSDDVDAVSGSHTMSWNWSTSALYAHAAAVIKPASAAARRLMVIQ